MSGWVVLDVPGGWIVEAQELRARRDARYRNVFEELPGDCRWVGELGEIALYSWLRDVAPGRGIWLRKDPAGRADFELDGRTVGMKTVKRQVPVRSGYTAQVTARHAAEPVAEYFFASYEMPRQRIWLLGGIRREEFLAAATFHGAGTEIHGHYRIRDGHAIYNIAVDALEPPSQWLAKAA